MFNSRIHEVKRENYFTAPVNEPRFDNPFLLKTRNDALNHWLDHLKERVNFTPGNNKISGPVDASSLMLNMDSLSLKTTSNFAPQSMPGLNPINPIQELQGLRSTAIPAVPRPLGVSDQELASIAQNEAYHTVDGRNGIRGYDLLEGRWAKKKGVSTENIVAYKDKNSPKIVLGIAGTHNWGDLWTDAKLGAGYKGTISDDRFNEADRAYTQLRKRFPDSPIVIGAHSLGSPLVLEVLRRHQDDKNVKGWGYNGWTHPTYTKDSRFTNIDVKGDAVADTRGFIQKEEEYIKNTIEDPEEAKKAKMALEASVGAAFGGYGATRAYNDYMAGQSGRVIRAYKNALRSYREAVGFDASGKPKLSPAKGAGFADTPRGGIAPANWKEIEDTFQRESGLVPKITYEDEAEPLKEFKLPLATDDEEGIVLRDGLNEAAFNEDEAVGFLEGQLEGVSAKRLSKAKMGAGLAVATPMIPYLLLHHDSKNFINSNAEAHRTYHRANKATTEDWKTGFEGAAGVVAGGVAGGAYDKVKDFTTDEVLERVGINRVKRGTKRAIGEMIERVKENATSRYRLAMMPSEAREHDLQFQRDPQLELEDYDFDAFDDPPVNNPPPARPTINTADQPALSADEYRYRQAVGRARQRNAAGDEIEESKIGEDTPLELDEVTRTPFEIDPATTNEFDADFNLDNINNVVSQVGGVDNPHNHTSGLNDMFNDAWANVAEDAQEVVELVEDVAPFISL